MYSAVTLVCERKKIFPFKPDEGRTYKLSIFNRSILSCGALFQYVCPDDIGVSPLC